MHGARISTFIHALDPPAGYTLIHRDRDPRAALQGSRVAVYTYTWDAKDRLVGITGGERDYVFAYDAQNRLVYNTGMRYVYDSNNRIIAEGGDSSLQYGYTWGADGRLLSVTDYTHGSPQVYQAVTDQRNTLLQLIDTSTGEKVADYNYDPYGNVLSVGGPAFGVPRIFGGMFCEYSGPASTTPSTAGTARSRAGSSAAIPAGRAAM